MLDWLKTILVEGYSEEIDKKVSAEIGKGFVAKNDFNSKNEELKNTRSQLDEANKTIEGLKSNAPDIDAVRKAADEWKAKYEQSEKDHKTKLADMEFDADIENAIAAAKGKNTKAIRALLDLDAIRASKNRSDDLKKAVEAVRESDGYLYDDDESKPAPRISAATPGAQTTENKNDKANAAIRAAFGSERKD